MRIYLAKKKQSSFEQKEHLAYLAFTRSKKRNAEISTLYFHSRNSITEGGRYCKGNILLYNLWLNFPSGWQLSKVTRASKRQRRVEKSRYSMRANKYTSKQQI